MKLKTTHTVLITRHDQPIGWAYGDIENYRVSGLDTDGSVSWTGKGFEKRDAALAYADAVYTGLRLSNVVATIDDRSAQEAD